MKRQRVNFFDLISGLFMIRTVWLHIAQLSGLYPNDVLDMVLRITFYAMPWFFFRSGYFFNLGDRSLKDYIAKLSRKLLLPFIIFSIIGFIIYLPFELYNNQNEAYRVFLLLPYSILRFGSGGLGNLPIWFLLSLFSSLLFFAIITKSNINKNIIFAFPLISYFLQTYNIKLPLGLSNLFLGVFFVYLGYLYKKFDKYNTILLIFSLVLFLLIQFFNYSYLDFRTNTILNGTYLSYIFSSIAGIIIIFNIGRYIDSIKPFNYIGKNSIIFFVLHWPVIFLVKNIFNSYENSQNLLLVFAVCSISVLLIMPIMVELINRRFSFLIGGEFPKKYMHIQKQWITLNYKK